MARIDIKSAGATLNDGVLQLENGVAMDATLRNVADQNNTTSPLLLSTTAVQVKSTLRITTNDNPYIDAEDGSTNNRFTVGRAPASQQVNVDFASNPTGSTTTVGAIRTYVDGTNLSEVMAFREDGNVGIGTTSPAKLLSVGGVGKQGFIAFNRSSDGVQVGQIYAAGSGMVLTTYAASGSSLYFDTGGRVSLGAYEYLGSGKFNIQGSGSTSATTSLLVQNSSGSEAFKVIDSGDVLIKDYLRPADGTSNSFVRLSNAQGTFVQYASGFIVLNPNFQYQSASYGDILFMSSTTGQFLLNGGTLENSAQMQINSTTRGFLPPVMTTTQKNAIATPAAGLMVYDTTLNKLCVYTTAWETITSI